MAIKYVRRAASVANENTGSAAGVGVESVNNTFQFNANGTKRTVTTTNNYGYAELALTNAQIKALRATPITIVAAPGAGKSLVALRATVLLDYGGTNAFTANASDNNITIRSKDGSGAIQLTGAAQAFVQGTADSICYLTPGSASVYESKTQGENVALVVHNGGAGEIAGNAANNNTMRVKLWYAVIDTGF